MLDLIAFGAAHRIDVLHPIFTIVTIYLSMVYTVYTAEVRHVD